MLNLSDKELDRLSREAADEHDPGDLMGPRSWERLELRLDKELGRVGSGPMQGIRGIRRMFYYYTPVIILLVGAGITYLVRQGKNSNARTEPSGSPPTAVIKSMNPEQKNSNDKTDPSTKTSENSNNSTSTPTDSLRSGSTVSTGSATPGQSSAPADKPTLAPNATAANRSNTRRANATAADRSASPGQSSATSGRSTPKPSTELSGSTDPNGASPGTPNSSTAGSSTRNATIDPASSTAANRSNTRPANATNADRSAPGKSSATTGRSIVPGATASGRSTNTPNATNSERSAFPRRSTTPNEGPAAAATSADINKEGSALNSPRRNRGRNNQPATKNNDNDLLTGSPSTGNSNTSIGNGNLDSQNTGPIGNAHNDNTTGEQKATREPRLALIQAPHSLARSRGIDDSALRAFTLKGASASTPIRLDKKKNASLFINRPLQIGFSFSPDFASVSALAGDRPGSSVGVTLDYQFLDRLYLSTGIFLTRKNYASSPNNYHVPPGYYAMNNIHEVNLIKGAFYMMEIPLNLRYDFHLSDNTSFFLSGGSSSYLMTSEHSQYYYNLFGTQACRNFDKDQESKRRNYLFSTVNLSMGVETGLSNSLSLLIAPYVKVPTGGIGFGQVQITSVGINFALKFAPVVSRKRQH